MDPVVVLVLSLGFIFSVVALHSMYTLSTTVFLADKSKYLTGMMLMHISQSSPRSPESSHDGLARILRARLDLAKESKERLNLCRSTGVCGSVRWMEDENGTGHMVREKKPESSTKVTVEDGGNGAKHLYYYHCMLDTPVRTSRSHISP